MKLPGRLRKAFAGRALVTAVGTKRTRVIGHCRSFPEEGKRKAGGVNPVEGSNSDGVGVADALAFELP